MEAETVRWRRRALLALSLAGNLGVLAYFKYVNFFLDVSRRRGWPRPPPWPPST